MTETTTNESLTSQSIQTDDNRRVSMVYLSLIAVAITWSTEGPCA